MGRRRRRTRQSGASRYGAFTCARCRPFIQRTSDAHLECRAKRDGPVYGRGLPVAGAGTHRAKLDSPDDPSFRSTVISRWPDGSASVVVVAGETGVTLGASKQIRLRAAAAGPSGLTAARVGQLVTDVTVDCGALGSATFTDFTAPSKVWWANERVVCARYRKPVGTHTTLEAVIDIHAFSSNRALVSWSLKTARWRPRRRLRRLRLRTQPQLP